VEKPVKPGEILTRIAEALRRSGRTATGGDQDA